MDNSIEEDEKMHTPETKRKISETKKRLYAEGKIIPFYLNKKRSTDFKRKISLATTGRITSKETIEKQREAKLGERNPMFGRTQTECTKMKVRLHKLAEKNPNWKGDDVKDKRSYHEWLKKRYLAPKLCPICHKDRKLTLASINGHNYTRNIKDYTYACYSCHALFDGRGLQ